MCCRKGSLRNGFAYNVGSTVSISRGRRFGVEGNRACGVRSARFIRVEPNTLCCTEDRCVGCAIRLRKPRPRDSMMKGGIRDSDRVGDNTYWLFGQGCQKWRKHQFQMLVRGRVRLEASFWVMMFLCRPCECSEGPPAHEAVPSWTVLYIGEASHPSAASAEDAT